MARGRARPRLLNAVGGALVLLGAFMLVSGVRIELPSAALAGSAQRPAGSQASTPRDRPLVASADEPGVAAARLRIDRLGIDAAVIEGDGISVPTDAVAHYPGTAWPGGGANIYMYGHAREGLFKDLWKASTGDLVGLDLVDGRHVSYVVTQVLPLVAWDDLSYLGPGSGEQLTLQTCISFDEHAPRLIVVARPVPTAA